MEYFKLRCRKKVKKNDREKDKKMTAKRSKKIKKRKMKIIKEQFDNTDEEIMRITCEDWEHIMDGGVLAVWGKDILNLENREE